MLLLPELYFTYLPAVTILLTIFLEFPISILVVGEALLFPLGGAPAAGEGGGGGGYLATSGGAVLSAHFNIPESKIAWHILVPPIPHLF